MKITVINKPVKWQCIPTEVKHFVNNHVNATIVGGFVRDMLVGDPYRDIDIYTSVAATNLEGMCFGPLLRTSEWARTYEIMVTARNTDDTMIFMEPRQVQIINMDVQDFDLACCQVGIWKGKYFAIDGALDHLSNRTMGLIKPTPITYHHMMKLLGRGWKAKSSEWASSTAAAGNINTFGSY